MIEDAGLLQLPSVTELGTKRFERREILKMGLAGFLISTVPLLTAKKAFAAADYGSWNVAFHNAHTNESFAGVYRVGDKYLPEAFERMNYVLRDFRTNEVFPMDPHVLDIISVIQAKTKTNHQLQILSGYRCPQTNAMLSAETTGVAKNSFHMYGQAIDIRMPGFRTSGLRDIAMNLRAGGVGYYPNSDFVHVDTGTIRHW